nr:Uncharacterised protein [Streptococcus thermophilus]
MGPRSLEEARSFAIAHYTKPGADTWLSHRGYENDTHFVVAPDEFYEGAPLFIVRKSDGQAKALHEARTEVARFFDSHYWASQQTPANR